MILDDEESPDYTGGEPYGVIIPMPEECDKPHPLILNMRCERKRNHDGWHRAENIWWG